MYLKAFLRGNTVAVFLMKNKTKMGVNMNASLIPRSKKEDEKGTWFQPFADMFNFTDLSISGRVQYGFKVC